MKIKLEKGQKLFFTSDTHYSHTNICRPLTNWVGVNNGLRDFETIEEMNNILVGNINEMVSEDDILFHLGDWSFGGFGNIAEFRERINCKNVHLILGNHDEHIQKNKNKVQSIFSSVNNYLVLDIKKPSNEGFIEQTKYKIILFHFPISSWDDLHKGSIHLHGHIHSKSQNKIGVGRLMDVGVDGNEFYPYEFNDVVNFLCNKNVDCILHKKEKKQFI